jgi:hypothetical protein
MFEAGQPLRIFLIGIVGSIAVEVWNSFMAYESGRKLPARYKRKGFWLVRCLMALIGGFFAFAYQIQSDLLAFHIGASAPALMGTFARRTPALPSGD